MKDISVIIPVYNVEDYVEKCIDSIIDQTFKNFEIILVDDGSTDRSKHICDRYSEKYNFIRTYHKENGGLSDARNFGIKKALGKYIIFIDSDDFISPHLLELLINTARQYNSDLVMSGLEDYYDGDEINEKKYLDNSSCKLSRKQAYEKMFLQDEIDVNATAKLYKKTMFEDIEFPIGKLYEDIQIIDKLVEKSNNISMITFKGYYYLQRPNSIMYGGMSEKRKILIDKAESLIEFIKEKYPNIGYSIIKRYVYCNFHILGRSIKDDSFYDYSKQLRKNILKYKKIIFRSKFYTKKEKLATLILILGLPVYKKFWNGYCNLKKC